MLKVNILKILKYLILILNYFIFIVTFLLYLNISLQFDMQLGIGYISDSEISNRILDIFKNDNLDYTNICKFVLFLISINIVILHLYFNKSKQKTVIDISQK